MARHKGREQALQMLFQWDLRRTATETPDLEDILKGYYGSLLVSEDAPNVEPRDPFAESLLRGVVADITVIDEIIARHAANWKIPRMPVVDRNVLRIGIHEMMGTDTPAAVAIDEGLEIARRFSGEESVQFVNGVLDAAKRELKPKREKPEPTTTEG